METVPRRMPTAVAMQRRRILLHDEHACATRNTDTCWSTTTSAATDYGVDSFFSVTPRLHKRRPVAPFSRQWQISASRPRKCAREPFPAGTGAFQHRLARQRRPAQGTTIHDVSLSLLPEATPATIDDGAAMCDFGRPTSHSEEMSYGTRKRAQPVSRRAIVSKLRRKLSKDADRPTCTFTEPRVGYRMPKAGRCSRSKRVRGRPDGSPLRNLHRHRRSTGQIPMRNPSVMPLISGLDAPDSQ